MYQIDNNYPIPPPSKHESGRKPSKWEEQFKAMKHGQSVHFDDAYEGTAFTQYINNRTNFRARTRIEFKGSEQNGLRVWKIRVDCPLLAACKATLRMADEAQYDIGRFFSRDDFREIEDAVKGADGV